MITDVGIHRKVSVPPCKGWLSQPLVFGAVGGLLPLHDDQNTQLTVPPCAFKGDEGNGIMCYLLVIATDSAPALYSGEGRFDSSMAWCHTT